MKRVLGVDMLMQTQPARTTAVSGCLCVCFIFARTQTMHAHGRLRDCGLSHQTRPSAFIIMQKVAVVVARAARRRGVTEGH